MMPSGWAECWKMITFGIRGELPGGGGENPLGMRIGWIFPLGIYRALLNNSIFTFNEGNDKIRQTCRIKRLVSDRLYSFDRLHDPAI